MAIISARNDHLSDTCRVRACTPHRGEANDPLAVASLHVQPNTRRDCIIFFSQLPLRPHSGYYVFTLLDDGQLPGTLE